MFNSNAISSVISSPMSTGPASAELMAKRSSQQLGSVPTLGQLGMGGMQGATDVGMIAAQLMQRNTNLAKVKMTRDMRAELEKSRVQAHELMKIQLEVTSANRSSGVNVDRLAGQFRLMSRIQQSLSS